MPDKEKKFKKRMTDLKFPKKTKGDVVVSEKTTKTYKKPTKGAKEQKKFYSDQTGKTYSSFFKKRSDEINSFKTSRGDYNKRTGKKQE
tara:strand:- start:1225 stop:1488 length:264 start_codon:yes stop_codon:yes gene_type:complete